MAPFLRLLKHRQLSTGFKDAAGPDGSGDSAGQANRLSEVSDAEQQQKALSEARRLALQLLAQREFTFSELVDRLETKGCTRLISQRVVQQLQEDGLQSDERFAEVFARSRMARGHGPMLLRAEMRARGLSDTLTDDYATHPHAHWIKLATAALQKRFHEAPTNRDEWAKQARFLARRGFSADLIYSALGDQQS
jgi:regulatory protein